MRRFFPILSCTALLLAAAPAQADRALDRIFDETQLASVETAETLRFAYHRMLPATDKVPNIPEGVITLTVEPAEAEQPRMAVVRISDGTHERRLEDFPGDAGNPLVIVFLESISTTVSKATGGSPFYIKNRIKDAFRAGSSVETKSVSLGERVFGGERITYMPFARETRTDRLGIFADLEISFVLSEDVPGQVLELSAVSGGGRDGGYEERIALIETEAAE